jgi:hypothetical protein
MARQTIEELSALLGLPASITEPRMITYAESRALRAHSKLPDWLAQEVSANPNFLSTPAASLWTQCMDQAESLLIQGLAWRLAALFEQAPTLQAFTCESHGFSMLSAKRGLSGGFRVEEMLIGEEWFDCSKGTISNPKALETTTPRRLATLAQTCLDRSSQKALESLGKVDGSVSRPMGPEPLFEGFMAALRGAMSPGAFAAWEASLLTPCADGAETSPRPARARL